MELYFGTKRVNPNEQIGVRNTTLPIKFRTLKPRPRVYIFLIVDLTRNELKHVEGRACCQQVGVGSRIFELNGKPRPFQEGTYGAYYFNNPRAVSKDGFILDIDNFINKYSFGNYGKNLVEKYAFYIVSSIATPERFNLLFPSYIPLDIQRTVLTNDLFSIYDIQEICQESSRRGRDLCDNKFYDTLKRQRLNKSEKYWVAHQEIDIVQTLIDMESKSLQTILDFPIVVRKLLYINNINIIEELSKYLTLMIENVPLWAYQLYFSNEFASGWPILKIKQLNILLEAIFPSNDGEGTEGPDTVRFTTTTNVIEESERVWDWIVLHLTEEDFNEGLEWIVSKGLYLSLLEKFLQYLSSEDRKIYIERYNKRPLHVLTNDLRTQEGLASYLRYGLNIDNETLIEHGIQPI